MFYFDIFQRIIVSNITFCYNAYKVEPGTNVVSHIKVKLIKNVHPATAVSIVTRFDMANEWPGGSACQSNKKYRWQHD